MRNLVDASKPNARLGVLRDLLLNRLQVFMNRPIRRSDDGPTCVTYAEDQPAAIDTREVCFIRER